MRLVRQVLGTLPTWRQRVVLQEPDSIGFAIYELA
jgi:hypothetical protein